jgi:hypothetical protein
MIQKVAHRARLVRNRYLARKIMLLREYLETGDHRTQVRNVVQGVIAELRFRQMAKREIDQLVSNLERGSSRKRIDRFVGSLAGDRGYTVYTTVPSFGMEPATTSLPGIQLLREPRFLREREAATELHEVISKHFKASAHNRVVAESAVVAGNPAEAVAKARMVLDAVASLVVYLGPGESTRGGSMRESPSLVYEGDRLARAAGIGVVRDDSPTLRGSMKRRLRSLLRSIGADLPPASRTELQDRALTSMHWYMLGATSRTLEERYVDHSISLEVLVSGKQTERDKSRVWADRATRLRRILQTGKDEHRGLIRHLYEARCDLVHAGLYAARTLLQDSRDLEGAVLHCLSSVIEGIGAGCTTLTDLLERIERQRVRARNRRIRQSRLTPGTSAAFRGRLLFTSGKKVADVRGRLSLIDEGPEGYAYHDLVVSDVVYKKPLRLTSADEFWFKGRSAGHTLELRDGWVVGGWSMFFVIGGRSKRFTYRAFDGIAFL